MTDKNSLPRSATAKRTLALQLDSINTNDSTFVEQNSKTLAQNKFNTYHCNTIKESFAALHAKPTLNSLLSLSHAFNRASVHIRVYRQKVT